MLAAGAELSQVAVASDVTFPIDCQVAVRYRGRPVPARVHSAGDGRASVRLQEPVHAVVPGQVAVFYRGDRVLGGGVIARAQLASSLPLAPAQLSPGALS